MKGTFISDSAALYPSQSYLASLLKGNYKMNLELTRHAERQPDLTIFKTQPPYGKWRDRRWKISEEWCVLT
jgi:hypothetical protein